MREIKENIPIKLCSATITIMGHDMGAVFVGYHLISKISPSYFARAVMLGGSPNQPHVFDSSQDAYRAGMDFATTLGCVNTVSFHFICVQSSEINPYFYAAFIF